MADMTIPQAHSRLHARPDVPAIGTKAVRGRSKCGAIGKSDEGATVLPCLFRCSPDLPSVRIRIPDRLQNASRELGSRVGSLPARHRVRHSSIMVHSEKTSRRPAGAADAGIHPRNYDYHCKCKPRSRGAICSRCSSTIRSDRSTDPTNSTTAILAARCRRIGCLPTIPSPSVCRPFSFLL